MGMTNAKLFSLARRYKAIDAETDPLAKEKSAIKTRITKEMERRTAKKIESDDGVTVTLSQGKSVIYHEDEIQDALTPAQWRQVTKRVLDYGKLLEMVQNGDLPADFLDDKQHIQHNAAYPTITIKE